MRTVGFIEEFVFWKYRVRDELLMMLLALVVISVQNVTGADVLSVIFDGKF